MNFINFLTSRISSKSFTFKYVIKINNNKFDSLLKSIQELHKNLRFQPKPDIIFILIKDSLVLSFLNFYSCNYIIIWIKLTRSL
jgi:hypothetical protein